MLVKAVLFICILQTVLVEGVFSTSVPKLQHQLKTSVTENCKSKDDAVLADSTLTGSRAKYSCEDVEGVLINGFPATNAFSIVKERSQRCLNLQNNLRSFSNVGINDILSNDYARSRYKALSIVSEAPIENKILTPESFARSAGLFALGIGVYGDSGFDYIGLSFGGVGTVGCGCGNY